MNGHLFEPKTRSPAAGFGANATGGYTRETWLTPRSILAPLGHFDLDPCAAPEPRPWPTATRHIALPDDGLAMEWSGRVWLNPPYGRETGRWLARLAQHRDGGLALVFARTDTADFQRHVLKAASAVLFLAGRIRFREADGSPAPFPSGAPSCLVAYTVADAAVLERCGLPGVVVRMPLEPIAVDYG